MVDYVTVADQISSASDRGAIGNLEPAVDYNSDGLKISHLLSGAKQNWQTKPNLPELNHSVNLSSIEQELIIK